MRQDERPDEQRIQREERRIETAVIAVVRDPEVPDRVPAGERREEDVAEPAERMRQRFVVELGRVRAAVGAQPQGREQRHPVDDQA
jgi:hypothetical protein